MQVNIKHLLEIVMLITMVHLTACDKERISSTCTVENPTEDLDWLKEAIENVEGDVYSWYGMANYNGETVFYYHNCDPVVNYASFTLNCSGERLGYTNDLSDQFTEAKVLWKHPDSECNFE